MAAGIKKNLSGMVIGSLLVLGDSGERHPTCGEVLWECQCACGKKKNIRTAKLTQPVPIKSCGCLIKPTKKLPGTKELRKRLRKQAVPISKAPDETLYEIMEEMIQGRRLIDICSDRKIDYHSTQRKLNSFRDCLNTAWELHTIMKVKEGGMTQEQVDNALVTRYLQPSLAPFLSKANCSTLTEQEIVYCWVYVNSGSNNVALRESGFSDLIKDTKNRTAYMNLLGIFLREKLNVAKYIEALQKSLIENTDVSKQYVQSELIKQVEQLKEVCASDGSRPADRSNILKAIEMLGRSVGAFTDKIQVEEMNPNDALDILVKKAQEPIEAGEYSVKEIS